MSAANARWSCCPHAGSSTLSQSSVLMRGSATRQSWRMMRTNLGEGLGEYSTHIGVCWEAGKTVWHWNLSILCKWQPTQKPCHYIWQAVPRNNQRQYVDNMFDETCYRQVITTWSISASLLQTTIWLNQWEWYRVSSFNSFSLSNLPFL